MTFQHPVERTDERGRGGRFEHLAESASNFTASPAFYGLCVAMVTAFVVVHVLGVPLNWQLFTADVMTAVTLLLLALLKNSERRAEHALQTKLDAIAAALLEQGGSSHEARDALRKVIGIHEEA
ncbi:low affinity iron permease family protein [Streptomyces sp. NPDC088732]|uniref:low affinity iron permease family protein n=1 Tax=Streptomyces sp. NPDC088732 TaxID=3365879 RepID=UPI00381500E0